MLAVRKDAAFDGSKPIAGGLQICWPQFGAGAIQQHGFARNLPWEVASHSSTEPEATLVLKANDATRKIWDQDFELHLMVRLEADHLLTRLTAKNTGSMAWDFTGALHSYYGVSDVSKASISGVQGATFVDKTQDPFKTVTLPPAELGIQTFLEGVLPDLKGPVSLSDKGRRVRTSVTHTKGWNDYILWAPVGTFGNCRVWGRHCLSFAHCRCSVAAHIFDQLTSVNQRVSPSHLRQRRHGLQALRLRRVRRRVQARLCRPRRRVGRGDEDLVALRLKE